MKHTLINAPSFREGKLHAKRLFPSASLVESFSDLQEPDLFNADKPALFLFLKAPSSAEALQLQKTALRQMVLITEKLPPQNALLAWIKKEGTVIDLCHEAPWQKQKRLEAEIKKADPSIEPAALKALLALAEEDLTSELEKLTTYNSHITLESITALVPYVPSTTVWNFLDALLQKDKNKALSCKIGGLDAYFGLMKLARAQQKNLLIFKKAPPGQKREALSHVKDRPFQNIQAAAPHFTAEELEASLVNLDKLDFMMRDGLTDENIIHTLLVSYTC